MPPDRLALFGPDDDRGQPLSREVLAGTGNGDAGHLHYLRTRIAYLAPLVAAEEAALIINRRELAEVSAELATYIAAPEPAAAPKEFPLAS